VRAQMPLVVVVGVPVGRVGVLVMVVAPVMPVVMLAARRRPRGCLHDGAQRNPANSITPRRVVVVMMLLTTLGACHVAVCHVPPEPFHDVGRGVRLPCGSPCGGGAQEGEHHVRFSRAAW
jgi:hypothetical protein